MQVVIETEDPAHADARACLAAYFTLLARRIPGIEGSHVPDPDPEASRYRPPGGTFLVARWAGRPVGCVALKDLGPEAGEVKRLWVAAEVRGQGLARRLMATLEEGARALGKRRLVLDTNEHLTEAIALYRASGWTETDPYSHFPATHWFAKAL